MRTAQAKKVVPAEPEKKDELKETKPTHDAPQDEPEEPQRVSRPFGYYSEMEWVHPSNFL